MGYDDLRLNNWDYRQDAAYYITICTKDREPYFGNINSKESFIDLTEIGKIADMFWLEIPEHFPFVRLGAHIIMHDHMHGIVMINNQSHTHRCRRGVACNTPATTMGRIDEIDTLHVEQSKKMSDISPKKGSLSSVIRSYKSAVSR